MATERELKQEMGKREAVSVELENPNAELERFAYTVSHDLKTPLVTIKGFLGLLSRDLATNDMGRVAGDIEKINSAADKMGALLDDLLELGRIGRVIGDPVNCDLSEIATQASQLIETQIEQMGIEIVIDSMPSIQGDEIRLVEVFLNLIENAIKFMGNQKSPYVHIGAVEKDGMICCYVKDNGIGVDARFQEQIFGLFERLSADVGGTGVGLALVKRIIEVHGGKIWVESDGDGQGSIFYFTLPPGIGENR
jgi:signal transduction histidine kinase